MTPLKFTMGGTTGLVAVEDGCCANSGRTQQSNIKVKNEVTLILLTKHLLHYHLYPDSSPNVHAIAPSSGDPPNSFSPVSLLNHLLQHIRGVRIEVAVAETSHISIKERTTSC